MDPPYASFTVYFPGLIYVQILVFTKSNTEYLLMNNLISIIVLYATLPELDPFCLLSDHGD